MCGIFGFVARGSARLNLARLKGIATVTMRRGPHAWGMAWIDAQGRLKMYKESGRIVDRLDLLAMAADARMLIGHCRWATQGDPGENINNHPHPADGGWIVHNGVISDYRQLVAWNGLAPVSGCDSEILGQFIERSLGTLSERCAEAVTSCRKAPLVMLGIWNRPGRLVAVRQGNPLHMAIVREGVYLASLSEGMPGTVKEVKDETVLEFRGKQMVQYALER